MPDQINAEGLVVKSLNEIIDEIETGLRAIYGPDIILDPDTPDGQLVQIFAQAAADIRQVILDINAFFDPDQAIGTALDQRVALNGITRRPGTHSRVVMAIETDRAVSLTAGEYFVKDDAGTRWVLESDLVIAAAGTEEAYFSSVDIGAILATPNTITTAETIVAGVVSVTNPYSLYFQGSNEESDEELRERRKRSVTGSAMGYIDAIESKILELDDVAGGAVYENNTAVTDASGTPAHTIWAIVDGGDDDDIADILYRNRPLGCGMRGAVEVIIPRDNGPDATMKFDRPIAEDLYIQFTLSVVGGGFYDAAFIKDEIVAGLVYKINQEAGTDELVAFLKSLNPKYRITDPGVGTDGVTWDDVATPSTLQHRFVLDTANITIIEG